MCQSKAEGGRRCSAHSLAVRAFRRTIQAAYDLDPAQAQAVYRKAMARARIEDDASAPTLTQWREYLDSRIHEIAGAHHIDAVSYERAAWALHAARDEVPDARRYAALKDMWSRGEKARNAIRRQVEVGAAMNGATTSQAWERFRAFRDQYQRDYAALPADQRPDPDPEWVRGFTSVDTMSMSTPDDPATLYAMYRIQADPNAFPANPDYRIASIDLETSGPEGKDGFNPVHGAIIEVGVITCDRDGNPTSTWEQLIRPSEEHLAAHGTGAEDIHHISLADLDGQPSWEQVAPTLASQLHGTVMLAQNKRFETEWLDHHMNSSGHRFDRYAPALDSMCVAKQHFPDLSNFRLSTICERVGVPYTDGHRALHDARVALDAYLSMRARIHSRWAECPNRAAAPAPPVRFTRLTAGTFDPSQDPFGVPRSA